MSRLHGSLARRGDARTRRLRVVCTRFGCCRDSFGARFARSALAPRFRRCCRRPTAMTRPRHETRAARSGWRHRLVSPFGCRVNTQVLMTWPHTTERFQIASSSTIKAKNRSQQSVANQTAPSTIGDRRVESGGRHPARVQSIVTFATCRQPH